MIKLIGVNAWTSELIKNEVNHTQKSSLRKPHIVQKYVDSSEGKKNHLQVINCKSLKFVTYEQNSIANQFNTNIDIVYKCDRCGKDKESSTKK